MKNNHGQVLVIFIILLPLLFLFCAYIVDISYISYHKNKLDNVNSMVMDYVLDNPDTQIEEVGKLIRQNDEEVMITKINLDDSIEIKLEKQVKSIFGRLIGKNSYTIESSIFKEKVNVDDIEDDVKEN